MIVSELQVDIRPNIGLPTIVTPIDAEEESQSHLFINLWSCLLFFPSISSEISVYVFLPLSRAFSTTSLPLLE